MIKFKCSECGMWLQVPDENAGQQVPCKCGRENTVPMPAPWLAETKAQPQVANPDTFDAGIADGPEGAAWARTGAGPTEPPADASRERLAYEEFAQRLSEHNAGAPWRRYRTWIIIAAVYTIGCLLLWSGIAQAVMNLAATGTWDIKAEPRFFRTLVNAAATLVRPFLVVAMPFTLLLVLAMRLASLAAEVPLLILALIAVVFGFGKLRVWLSRRMRHRD